MVSARERIAHVLRRCAMGAEPDVAEAAPSVDAALARVLDLGVPVPPPPVLPPPADEDAARDPARLREPLGWWLQRMVAGERPIEERLVWFWTDHFATGLQKVRSPDLIWRQHLTIRRHATGSFADLLHAIAEDGAMLVYLDGVQNTAQRRNENFAREVMELHTLGRGHYTQDDVVAAARACSGWVVHLPFVAPTRRPGTEPFSSYLVPARHDGGVKTLLGRTGAFGLHDAIDVLLEQEQTARTVGAKLHRALVGLEPDGRTLDRVAAAFRRDWSILAAVEAIVSTPAFTSDEAVRTHVRTPLEKLVALAQAAGGAPVDAAQAWRVLRVLGHAPFLPPNPAGYPQGRALLGPHGLVHTFDLTTAVAGEVDADPRATLARFGCFDVRDETLAAVAGAPDARTRTLLALGSPEVALR
ncbi:MAG: hypothetical protein KatS3mg009_1324 [Acidimicrobiia bacterium]|nr:MAG: hypothetical protein KatS3mg009_1324 [Acidimicrobiia bacterium]